MAALGAQTRRRRLMATARQVAGVGVVAVLTVVLAQSSTTAAFTASTSDAGNSVGASTQFCSSPGPATAPSAVDTALYQAGANANTNYSNGTQIGAGSGAGANVRTLLKFTLPSRPPGCLLSSATLSLRASSPSPGGSIEVHRVAAAWNVATVTWNTQPAVSTTPAPAVSPSLSGVGVQTWNVTTLVSALYAGTDNGFLIKDSIEGSGSRYNLYDSMDVTTASYRPQLSVIWD